MLGGCFVLFGCACLVAANGVFSGMLPSNAEWGVWLVLVAGLAGILCGAGLLGEALRDRIVLVVSALQALSGMLMLLSHVMGWVWNVQVWPLAGLTGLGMLFSVLIAEDMK